MPRGSRGRGAPPAGREPGPGVRDDPDWDLADWGLDAELQHAGRPRQAELHAVEPERQDELQEVPPEEAERPSRPMPQPANRRSRQDPPQHDSDWEFAEELQRQERLRQGRPREAELQQDVDARHGRFMGPDLASAEVRAVVGFLNGTFRIPALDPDSPDLWVENVRDALFSSGMASVFLAADCRKRAEVPVRVRNEVDTIEKWRLAYAWTALRRSLNAVPSLFARTQRCSFADVESLVRSVLDVLQKRSQGVESRLRDEVMTANLADYPSLANYIADFETRFNKLAAHGVHMTDSEQRHLLLRGLTSNYEHIKTNILSHRNMDGSRADFATAISLLEDYEDNQVAVSNSMPARTQPLNREVTVQPQGYVQPQG